MSTTEKTKLGTPCSLCGKPIGKAMLKQSPWATECSGRHMAQVAIREAKPFIDAENERYRRIRLERQRAALQLRVLQGGLAAA